VGCQSYSRSWKQHCICRKNQRIHRNTYWGNYMKIFYFYLF